MNTPRFNGRANEDQTGRRLFNDFQEPAYAATIALVTKAAATTTLVKPATLTGAVTFTAGVGSATTPPHIGDTLELLLTPDGTSRIATFSTGFVVNGTLTVTTAKFAYIKFMFNGTAWQETGRTVTA